ncbi:uncharacterized protein RNJ42_04029 [Nakaseomyces bracarensis]|uniref:uncharacterized protein n=1 Tax=Nakaseomyces bracarensis TaxID=273131 RepID=UPI003871EC94
MMFKGFLVVFTLFFPRVNTLAFDRNDFANPLYADKWDIMNTDTQNPYPFGCSPNVGIINSGLKMELWEYSYRFYYRPCIDSPEEQCWVNKSEGYCFDSSYLDFNYPRYGYQNRRKIGQSEGVTGILDFTFSSKHSCYLQYGTLPSVYNYPSPITTTNFTMIMYGYFKPKESGVYTFYIDGDDLLYLNFGAGNAFDCCRLEKTFDKFGNYQAYALWGSRHVRKQLKVHLDGDSYYPLRIFLNNRDHVASLSLSFSINENPTKINDFTGYLFSISDSDIGCPNKIIYDTKCGNVTSAKTYSTEVVTKLNTDIEMSTIYHIYVPCSSSTSILCDSGFYDPIHNSCVITSKSTVFRHTTKSSSSALSTSTGSSTLPFIQSKGNTTTETPSWRTYLLKTQIPPKSNLSTETSSFSHYGKYNITSLGNNLTESNNITTTVSLIQGNTTSSRTTSTLSTVPKLNHSISSQTNPSGQPVTSLGKNLTESNNITTTVSLIQGNTTSSRTTSTLSTVPKLNHSISSQTNPSCQPETLMSSTQSPTKHSKSKIWKPTHKINTNTIETHNIVTTAKSLSFTTIISTKLKSICSFCKNQNFYTDNKNMVSVPISISLSGTTNTCKKSGRVKTSLLSDPLITHTIHSSNTTKRTLGIPLASEIIIKTDYTNINSLSIVPEISRKCNTPGVSSFSIYSNTIPDIVDGKLKSSPKTTSGTSFAAEVCRNNKISIVTNTNLDHRTKSLYEGKHNFSMSNTNYSIFNTTKPSSNEVVTFINASCLYQLNLILTIVTLILYIL